MAKPFRGFSNRPQPPVVNFKDSPFAAHLLMLNNNWDNMVLSFSESIEKNREFNPFDLLSIESCAESIDPRSSFYQITGGRGDFDKLKTVLKVETVFALMRSYESNKKAMGFEIAQLNKVSEIVNTVVRLKGVTPRQFWDMVIHAEGDFGIDQIIDYLLKGEEVSFWAP